MKVVSFCGWRGMRLDSFSENLPKPLASIGGRPRVRGMECRSPSGLAEAFYARKLVL